jgi:hypothetical protein
MFNTSASRRGALAGSTLALSVAIVLIAAPSAHAVEGPAETVSAASTAAENNDAANPVAPLQAVGGDESIASVMSPSGCAGQTDYAHVSGIYASVHGRTTCGATVAALGVTTTIQRLGWLYWESQLADDSSRANSNNSQDAHPHLD